MGFGLRGVKTLHPIAFEQEGLQAARGSVDREAEGGRARVSGLQAFDPRLEGGVGNRLVQPDLKIGAMPHHDLSCGVNLRGE